MNIYLGLGLLLFLGALTKFVERKSIKWITILWFGFVVLVGLFFGAKFSPIFISTLIKLPFVYLWLLLLDYLKDSIFLYLIVLLGGGIILGVISL